jgi:hypothetical protein
VGRMLLWAIPLVTLAACGGAGSGAENKGKAKAKTLQPGQYEVTAEVTAFKAADKGTPKIDTKQGTSTTRSVCVTDPAALPTDLFADEGFVCRNAGSMFARGGTLSASLECTRAGLTGAMGYAVSGTFSGDAFEAERQLKTRLSTDGDVEVTATLRGRRTGECTAAPAPGGAEKSK